MPDIELVVVNEEVQQVVLSEELDVTVLSTASHGPPGADGAQGADGADGPAGAPGVGARLTDATSAATEYTLSASDDGKHIRFSSDTPVTVTIDAGSLASGFYCELRQDAAGQVSVVEGTGTRRSSGTGKTRALYSTISVYGTSANIGYVDGDMAAS